MKKTQIWVLVAVLALSLSAVGQAAGRWGQYRGFDVVKIAVDGREVTSDVPAIIVDGRTMVPLRFVSEALGREVEWDQETQTAKVTKKLRVVGPPDFVRKINQVLSLIEQHSPEEYATLNQHVDSAVYGIIGTAVFNADVIELSEPFLRVRGTGEIAEKSNMAALITSVVYFGEMLKAFHEGADVGDVTVQKRAMTVGIDAGFRWLESFAQSSEERTLLEGYRRARENPNPFTILPNGGSFKKQ